MTQNGHHWLAYDDGLTLGTTGLHGGRIVRDEEHPDGARLTLESDCLRVPYAITANLYGFGDHFRFVADEPTAQHMFDEMQVALAKLLTLVPLEDDPDYGDKYEAVNEALQAFAEQFR